jgi:cyclopropane fatty-acyl-phospholipid synthase-like methyltransferase
MNKYQEVLQKDNQGLGRGDFYVGYDYEDSIHESVYKESNFVSYKPLAERINQKFPEVKRILELGSGPSILSNHFRKINPNVDYITLDINKDIKNNGISDPNSHFIVFTDKPFQIQTLDGQNVKFDLIVSFEHFEHITSSGIHVLLGNIKNHSNENTKILATAANWGEGDDKGRHPLVLTISHWISLLNENGFDMIDEKNFRPRCYSL